MTIDSESDLFKAILAMDSYNRGYNAGIVFGSNSEDSEAINGITKLGAATVYLSADGTDAKNAGFYAIAYSLSPTDVIIAYRGTDQGLNPLTSADVWNAYGVGAGYADTPQSRSAFDFYNQVVTAAGSSATIELTGHSMGGGLAGLVAATYGKTAYLFDNMAFESAATGLAADKQSYTEDSGSYVSSYLNDPFFYYTHAAPTLLDSVYGSGALTAPNFSNIHTTSIDGEALSTPFVPGDHDHQTHTPITELSLGTDVNDALGVVGIGSPDAYDLHNIGTLVIRMFADSGEVSGTLWNLSAKYFWPVMYDTNFATAIGMGGVDGRYSQDSSHGSDTVLRTIIAYSAIDNGDDTVAARPFGDTGIRALYDDANDFGTALSHSDNGTRLTDAGFAKLISETFIQYAADLALNKVLQTNMPTGALQGVLTYTEATENHTLTLNFADSLWTFSGSIPTAIAAQDSLLAASVNVSSIHDQMVSAWGSADSSIIERAIFPRYLNSTTVIDDTTTAGKIAMFIGDTGNDVVKPSTGNNLILGESGTDTVDYSSLGHALATDGNATVITADKGDGNGKDILVNVEHIIATTYADNIHQHAVTGMNIDGGGGSDTVDYSALALPVIVGFKAGASAGLTTAIVKNPSDSGNEAWDTLNAIQHVIGTTASDSFDVIGGTYSSSNPLIMEGGGGSDSYTVDLAYLAQGSSTVDLGTVRIVEGVDGGTADSLEIRDPGGPNDTHVSIGSPVTVDGVTYTSLVIEDGAGNHVELQLDKAAIDAGNGLDTINFVGAEFSAKDFIDNMVTMAAGGPVTRADIDHLWSDLYSSGSGGAGYGGGTIVATDSNGDVVSQTVDKTATASSSVPNGGGVIGYASGEEVMHRFVVTSASVSGTGDTATTHINYQTSTQEIDLTSVSSDDIRFFLSGSQGHTNLTVNITSLNTAFTIQDFEVGKHITGTAVFTGELQVAVQTNDDASLVAMGIGSFAGAYAGDSIYSLIDFGAVDVTYFFDTLRTLGDGHVFNMQTDTLTFTGTSAGETVMGLDGRGDILNGLAGNDYLMGYGGDDVLNGGTGQDYLYGGQGDDTYVFNPGDSSASTADLVVETAGQGMDTIVLHGVDPGDVHLWTTTSANSLEISYSATDNILIANGTYSSSTGITVGSVEQIKLDDGTTLDLTGGLHLSAHTATANVDGTAFNDVIDGASGGNHLSGFAGDDVLTGGEGQDYLYGGQGDDTYVFNPGDSSTGTGDLVVETAGQGTDTIVLHGVDPGDVHLWTVNSANSLEISYSATDNIIIANGSYSSTTGVTVGSVEQIKFDNGTTLDLTGGLHLTAHTASANVYGTAFDDVLEGQSGNNYLYGYGGDDIFTGGGGADRFYGGAGADTFILDDAAHIVTIGDFSTSDGDVIDISSLLTGYDPVNDNLSDFVQLTTSGSNTLIKVDTDGTGTGHAMAQIATLSGVTGLNLNDLIDTGHLIVHAAA